MASKTHFQVLDLGLEPYTSPRKCPFLGSSTALFIDWLKRKKQKHKNFLNSGTGVARIFDWGKEAQFANHMQYDIIRNFQKEKLFMGQKCLGMKIRSLERRLVRKQDVAKGEELEPKPNVFKICDKLWRCGEETNVT